MTLYEFNQNLCNSLPDKDKEAIEKLGETVIKPYLEKHSSSYYLLLNNDLHYYTFFVFNEFSITNNLIDELIDLVSELGTIKSINLDTDGNAIEFWIKQGETTNLYVFFDYARGVIEIP